MTPEETKEPVNRGRRSKFIFWVVGFCLAANTIFGLLAGLGVLTANIALVTAITGGFGSVAIAATIAYVGGSSLDYNGGIGKLFQRSSVPQMSYLPSQQYTPPEYGTGHPPRYAGHPTTGRYEEALG